MLRPARLACCLYLAASTIGPGVAHADDPKPLGVIAGRAAASGLHAIYNPKGLIPTAALVDLGVPDALATIGTGPATFARASVADPGEIIANPDALLVQGGAEPGSVPPYPYRVSANSTTGAPTDESAPGPGLDARVEASSSASSATATTPAFDGGSIATIGSMSASTTTTTDGTTVTVHARSEISGFSLLAGLLRIDSIAIDLTATGDGTATSTTGGTTVTGATLAGTPVVIDQDGVHADPSGPTTTASPLGGLLGPVNDALHQALGGVGVLNDLLVAAGLHITVVEPQDLGTGTAKQRQASGVHIDVELSSATLPALQTLLDGLPYVPPIAPGAPGLSDLIAVARAHEIVALEVGRADVALDARPRPDAPARPSVVTPVTPTGAAGPKLPGAGQLSLVPSSGAPGASGAPLATTAQSSTGLPLGAGIAALALIGLIVVPFIGERLGAATTWLLPAAASAERCPLEGS